MNSTHITAPETLDRTPEGRGVLMVGAGGLGSPAARVLVQSGVTRFTLVDDDEVDISNLHRQTLYTETDQGDVKVEVAADRLRELAPHPEAVRIETHRERLLPDTALSLMKGHALVVEGADNFASKFLCADAARLSGVPIVQAGAVRWGGWALACRPGKSACMRCVFEDIPRGRPETCAVAGVMGPVAGVLGALQGALALRMLSGDPSAPGELWHYDGLKGRLRKSAVQAREGCPLCGGAIQNLDIERYLNPCAA